MQEIFEKAKKSAECTHNHPEGIKGAQSTALCIYLARHEYDKAVIRKIIEDEYHYDLSLTVDEIRPRYSWDGLDGKGDGGTCQGSVPEAIVCALEATGFEDAIRNAISIGGDSDTIGCITGSIAEPLYGIPDDIRRQGLEYLKRNEGFMKVVTEFEDKYGSR
jgi:ADP-ribosylglycohydrolase